MQCYFNNSTGLLKNTASILLYIAIIATNALLQHETMYEGANEIMSTLCLVLFEPWECVIQ